MRNTILALVCYGFLLSTPVSSLDGVLSIPPSLYWDGVDGSWSTFQVQVGTPGQTVRLLPGTSANAGNSIWAIIPVGCSASLNGNIDNCANERGYLFTSNESSTWTTRRLSNGGLYQLDTYEEGQLGLSGNAYYGFDTVSLGLEGQGLPVLQNQLIAGIATNDFWLGTLGLSPIAFNFTGFNDAIPSMVGTLRGQKQIGSTSWSYTAGARYRNPPVFGSLTLGGFDRARLNSSASLEAIPFGSDFSRDLVVAISSITYDTIGSAPLLAEGIYAFIDSMVTTMYLPISVCQAFEKAFNISWDPASELYLLSTEQHAALVAQDPTFSFRVSKSLGDGSSDTDEDSGVVLKIPYSAFDLNISQPYVNETTRYFPLKRAQNESQYTLGRVFLQETYLIADYDRQVFTLAQAAFPQDERSQSLQAISPPNASGSSVPSTVSTTKHASLSGGVIAGIVIGAVVILGLVSLAACILVRHRRRKRMAAQKSREHSNGEIGASVYQQDQIAELDPGTYAEVGEHGSAIYEIGSKKPAVNELSGYPGHPRVADHSMAHELQGHEVMIPELDSRAARDVKEGGSYMVGQVLREPTRDPDA